MSMAHSAGHSVRALMAEIPTAAAIVTNFALQHDTHHYRITVRGGELSVRFTHEAHTQIYTDVRLTGPARRVFGGTFERENF